MVTPDDIGRDRIDDLVRHIERLSGLPRRAFDTMSLATEIVRDFGIDGDDANELVPVLFDEYQVVIDDYDPYRYFHVEGYDLFRFWRGNQRQGNVPITLGMLLWAIKSGRWETAVLEGMEWSVERIYRVGDRLPVEGYVVRS